MATVTEIAPDIYRISVFVPEFNLQFNHFFIKDDEPLLFHTGYRGHFPEVREGVASVMDSLDEKLLRRLGRLKRELSRQDGERFVG